MRCAVTAPAHSGAAGLRQRRACSEGSACQRLRGAPSRGEARHLVRAPSQSRHAETHEGHSTTASLRPTSAHSATRPPPARQECLQRLERAARPAAAEHAPQLARELLSFVQSGLSVAAHDRETFGERGGSTSGGRAGQGKRRRGGSQPSGSSDEGGGGGAGDAEQAAAGGPRARRRTEERGSSRGASSERRCESEAGDVSSGGGSSGAGGDGPESVWEAYGADLARAGDDY